MAAPPINTPQVEEVFKNSTALSQITENRKVEAPKALIFRDPIFGFCLQKATLRQSRFSSLLAAGRCTWPA